MVESSWCSTAAHVMAPGGREKGETRGEKEEKEEGRGAAPRDLLRLDPLCKVSTTPQ